MTATYDGRLVLSGKAVEPCCATMHRAVVHGIFYAGTSRKVPVIAIRLAERETAQVTHCPFCGASVEVRP